MTSILASIFGPANNLALNRNQDGWNDMGKDCPKCGLFNPDTSERCDCGWDFRTKRVELSYADPLERSILANRGMTLTQVGIRNLKQGSVVFIVSVVGAVLIGAMSAASSSGYIVIWYGGMVFGAVQFVRGLRQYVRGRKFGL